MAEGACAHISAVKKVLGPKERVCDDCVKIGATWVHLRTCQSCGGTHCCDSSPNRHATKHAKRGDPADVTIEVIEHEDGVTICAKYPGAGNVCAPGDKGSSHTHNNDVEVDFEVRVPAGVRLVAHTVNGGIQAEGLAGPVEAETVNGAVRLSTSAYASAETVNGSITAALGSAEWTEPLSFNTVNGGIHLTLPAKLDVDLRARTLNGVVDSDFPVTVTGKLSKHSIHGTNGNISLNAGS